MNEKISVIVPIYNVEKYLDRCVESIVGQTYENLEIILVDDGSPDSCPQICDDWASKDGRIKVIHKENGGISSGRNAGIKSATGDYIAFVDGDDFIHKEMYEKLLASVKENHSDMSVCGFSHYYEESKEYKNVVEKNLKEYGNGNFLKYMLTVGHKDIGDHIITDNIMGSVCRCLFAKDIFQDISFNEDISFIAEDLIFMLNLFKISPKISVVEDFLYYYVQHKKSVSHSMSPKKIENYVKAHEILLKILNSIADADTTDAYKFHIYANILHDCLLHGQKKQAKSLIKTDFMTSLYSKRNYKLAVKNVSLKSYKLAYFLIYHHLFSLYSFLLKIRK